MQHLEVSGAVRHIYVIRRLKVKMLCKVVVMNGPLPYLLSYSNINGCPILRQNDSYGVQSFKKNI